MPMLEYTQKDQADTIQGRVMVGHGLKQEGEFRIDIAHNGGGWAWSMNVEIEGKAVATTETELDHPHENLTWREAAALAKTRVVELATVLEAELEGGGPPPPAPPRNSEKEDSMDRARAEMNGESTSEPTRWEAVKEAVGAGITRARAGKDPDYEHHPDVDARKAYEAELIRRNREIEADQPKAPPLMETVQQRGGVGFSRAEAEEERRLDVSTPGPTEAAGGSFQVLHSKTDAEHHAERLPQSQESRIDRVFDATGPTDSYAVTSLPAVAEVARDERVAERVDQIQDPARRAEAERLLRTIREEAAGRDRSTQRAQEAELER